MDVGTEHLKNLVRELYCRNGYSVFICCRNKVLSEESPLRFRILVLRGEKENNY